MLRWLPPCYELPEKVHAACTTTPKQAAAAASAASTQLVNYTPAGQREKCRLRLEGPAGLRLNDEPENLRNIAVSG